MTTSTTYTEIGRITAADEGLPVNLLLQLRHNVREQGGDYCCLSWRTRLSSSGTNRRWYYHAELGIWTVPVKIASLLLDRAAKKGWFSEAFDDPQIRHGGTDNTIIDSRLLSSPEYERELASIINEDWEDREQLWGHKPSFVIFEVPDGTWRKIMLLDSQKMVCTFRSATTETHVPHSQASGMMPPWAMHNSMQDASSAMMRGFHKVLKDI